MNRLGVRREANIAAAGIRVGTDEVESALVSYEAVMEATVIPKQHRPPGNRSRRLSA